MWILQICHSYYPPFLDCARQYSVLFKNTPYKVLTVYLTGERNADVARDTCSDEVLFLEQTSKQVGGMKLEAIKKTKKIAKLKYFKLCIAHRVKPTYVALMATSLPIVSVHHNYNDYSRWSRKLLVNFYKDRLLMLGVSNSVRNDLRCDLKGWDADRIMTLYNRIDVGATKERLLNKQDARKQLGIENNVWVLGTAGRLHHDKDYPTLLRGFASALPNLPLQSQLIIMGKGSLEDELKLLTRQLGIDKQVRFLGHLPNGAQYFKAFDAFALTSDHEPFGMVLLEAMAAEIPIICSDCGGGAEVIKKVGLLFDFRDINQLKKAILEVCSEFQERGSLEVLNTEFSDQAAKRVFWDLSFVKDVLIAGTNKSEI